MAIVLLILQLYIHRRDRWSRYRLSALLFMYKVYYHLSKVSPPTIHDFIKTRKHKFTFSNGGIRDFQHPITISLDLQDEGRIS